MSEVEEVELKLALPPADVARLCALPMLGAPAAALDQVSTYYDTPAGHLRKAGYSLRLRRTGRRLVQTLKERGPEAGGFSARAEWEWRVKGPGLDFEALAATPAGPLLARKKVRARLETVSETRVHRTTWLLRQDGSAVELILDVGEIVAGDRRDPVCEIELELKRGSRSALFDLAREIGREIPLRLGVMSKSERGVALAGGRKRRVHKAEPLEIRPESSIAEAFATIVQSCLRHFRRNETGAAARDAEAVHQLRVAIRRLRSALALFAPIVEGPEYECLRDELRSLSALLGTARDLDVTLAGLRRGHHEPAPGEVRRLKGLRSAAYDALLARLASDSLPGLFLDLAAWAESGAWQDSPRAARSIEAFAEERLGRLWRKLRRDGKSVDKLGADKRHRLRIVGKKLRYASEFFAGLAPGGERGRWRAFVDALAELQESLGALNDVETARSVLCSAGKSPDERRLLERAQRAMDALREAGPYWR
jgi:inorganic triphosphatase YgiF